MTAARLKPCAFWPFVGLAVAHVGQGQTEKAKAGIDEVQTRNPESTITKALLLFGDASLDHAQNWTNNLRQAGLPE